MSPCKAIGLGDFDVIFDPAEDDQVLVGQLSRNEEAIAYDVWTSFPSRTSRGGSAIVYDAPIRISAWRISASLDAQLQLKATTRAQFTVGPAGARALTFGLSRAEQVTAVRIDGVAAELLFHESARSQALRPDENGLFLVVAPQLLAGGSTHAIEIEHEGAVITDRGSGVYAVGARRELVPAHRLDFAPYDLEFRYPKDLTLVATGTLVEEHTEGAMRVTHRRTEGPVTIAGFNLGQYAHTVKNSGGMTVDVYGYRGLDPALAPRPRMTVVTQAVRPLYRGGVTTMQSTAILQMPAPPDPLAAWKRWPPMSPHRWHSSRRYSVRRRSRRLTISPIPGTSGKDFRG
ncbi:MAG: hypothetical protein WDO18_03725 [Acidobacteriota bacterium]